MEPITTSEDARIIRCAVDLRACDPSLSIADALAMARDLND